MKETGKTLKVKKNNPESSVSGRMRSFYSPDKSQILSSQQPGYSRSRRKNKPK